MPKLRDLVYRIEYRRDGKTINTAALKARLSRAVQLAREGLAQHDADLFKIVAVDHNDVVMATGRRESQET